MIAQAIEESKRIQSELEKKKEDAMTPQVIASVEKLPSLPSLASQPLPSLGAKKPVASGFDDINIEADVAEEEEQKDEGGAERLKAQRDSIFQKRQENRVKEIETYKQKNWRGEEDEAKRKQELIKKGMATINLQSQKVVVGVSELEMQVKRKNFMTGIRDAIIQGDQEAQVVKRKKKRVQPEDK